MNQRSDWLADHASDTYSQSGEDGVIAKILSLLPESDRWCVEFGAWDGIHLSNVRRLILEQGYRAVMIEGSETKYRSLVANYAGNASVHPVHGFVGFGAEDGLDAILSRYEIPKNFDFLSIDIDGNDYHVWNAIHEYRPKVVCVEFNPTVPTEVEFVQAADPRVSQGSSLLSLVELARAKQYELVCVLHVNAFFVDSKYFPRFDIADNGPHALRRDLSAVTWLFSGYDGTVHLAGQRKLPWHGVVIEERKVQALPRPLRRFPDRYTPVHVALFRVLKRLGFIRR
jgi:hypothetical protein